VKRILALFLVLILSVSMLAGCGSSLDPNDTAGRPPPAKCLASVWRWELQDKGKCVLSVDGSKANGTWTLNNGAFTVEGGGIDCAGRLENGVLTLENVMDMGITLVFYKDGVVPPPPAAAAGGAGYYVIDIIVQGSETYVNAD